VIDLTDRVVILTGASNPVGEAIGRQLVDAGARVLLGYRRHIEVIERLLKEIEPLRGLGIPYAVDVASRRSVDAMVAEALGQFGRIDALIHNAHGPIDRQPFLQLSWEDYEDQFAVAVRGGFNCCQAVLDEMVLRRQGKVLFILNTLLRRPVVGYNAYTAAVGALRAVAKDLANEVGELGIAVNTLSPGFTVTTETPHAPPRVQQALAGQTPLRRLATPEDIAQVALFFVSDLSNFVTGADLTVDGGYSFGYGGPPVEE